MDTNLVVLKGRLTKSAELKFTNKGTPCTSFSIAVNESIRQADGSYENRPNFFEVTLWGNYGKTVCHDMTKGREVLVTGRLRQDRWEGSAGTKNTKVQVIADNIELLRTPQGGQQESGQTDGAPEESPF